MCRTSAPISALPWAPARRYRRMSAAGLQLPPPPQSAPPVSPPGGFFVDVCYRSEMKTALKRRYLLTLFAKQDGKCCYCDRHVILSYRWRDQQRPDAATIEHLRRRADGGSNHPDNLAMACKECNDGRGPVDWLTYRSFKRGEISEFAKCFAPQPAPGARQSHHHQRESLDPASRPST
ncbi:HNH endonuclease [Rhizobium tropici]|nr:HNH endonuclease [Rhizobium tropici]